MKKISLLILVVSLILSSSFIGFAADNDDIPRILKVDPIEYFA